MDNFVQSPLSKFAQVIHWWNNFSETTVCDWESDVLTIRHCTPHIMCVYIRTYVRTYIQCTCKQLQCINMKDWHRNPKNLLILGGINEQKYTHLPRTRSTSINSDFTLPVFLGTLWNPCRQHNYVASPL